jgi:excisionase family DNA binding protein
MNFESKEKTVPNDLQAVINEMQKRIELLETLAFQAKEVLNLEEAAMFIGVTRSQLYKLTHNHAIPYFKPSGKLVYFERAELINWLRQNPVKSQSQINMEAQTVLQRLSSK